MFMGAISLNVLHPPQMDIFKFLVKIHHNIAALRQHPVPNAGPKLKNNRFTLRESHFLALVFSTVRNTCHIVFFNLSVQWDQMAVISKSDSPLAIAPLILL